MWPCVGMHPEGVTEQYCYHYKQYREKVSVVSKHSDPQSIWLGQILDSSRSSLQLSSEHRAEISACLTRPLGGQKPKCFRRSLPHSRVATKSPPGISLNTRKALMVVRNREQRGQDFLHIGYTWLQLCGKNQKGKENRNKVGGVEANGDDERPCKNLG